MATSTLKNSYKVAQISKTATTSASTGVIGGNYAMVNISTELSTLVGSDVTRLISVIPRNAVETQRNGYCGMVSPYLASSPLAPDQWVISAPTAAEYTATFTVIYK